MKQRVLHLTRNTRVAGGGPQIMSTIMNGIEDFDHQVAGLLTRRAITRTADYSDRIPLVGNCPLPTPVDLIYLLRFYRVSQAASKLLVPTFPERMSRQFGRYGFSLVHSHYSNAVNRQAEAVVLRMKTPFVWTAHSLPQEQRDSANLRKLNAISKRNPGKIAAVAVSRGVKNAIESICPDVDVELIYNGANVGEVRSDLGRRELLQQIGIHHPDPFIVCSVGRLNPEKGIGHLIRAARHVVRGNDRIFFVHLGEGYLLQTLKRMIADEGLTDKFFLIGHKKEVGTYLRISNLFVLPSLNEAFGLSLLEALTVGLPSVASNVGGVPEVTNDSCSILVEPGDELNLADAILKLSRDPERIESMSRAALRQSAKFSVAAMLSAYRSLYERLLGPSARSFVEEGNPGYRVSLHTSS